MSDTLLALLLGLLTDYCCGEPRKFHPLVGFGHWAHFIEKRLNGQKNSARTIALGALAWLLATAPVIAVLAVALYCAAQHSLVWLLVNAGTVYLCTAYSSLKQHCLQVLNELTRDDLPAARRELSKIVSRETQHLNPVQVRQAAIESVLENGLDAIFAAIFWFVVAGAPGILLYRLANTLDAMWGYKNPRFIAFGRFAARVDDLLNWLPARLVACSYALLGNTANGFKAWRHQARYCQSPNGGPVMCAGAGALSLRLGGSAIYHGKVVEKPQLGTGALPGNRDLLRAVNLVFKTLILWCLALLAGWGLMGLGELCGQ